MAHLPDQTALAAGVGPHLTVRDVLAMDSMSRAQLRAGADGLDRAVTGGLIIEVPEVRKWVKGGELLFSAAYAWRDEPERLVELTATLDEVGVPGLVMKLGWYLEELPAEMIRVADERAFPILQIPLDVPYRDVLEPLYERLNARTAQQLERHEDLRVLTRSGLDDQSIDKVVTTLATHLHRPIHVVDLVDDVLIVSSADGIAFRRTFNELDAQQEQLVETLRECRLRRTTAYLELPIGGAVGAGLIVGHESRGIIAVSVESEEPDSYLEVELTHSAELISFLLLKRLALLEGRRQAASLFFASLMEDTLSTEAAAERALTLGLRLTQPLMVATIGAAGGIPETLVSTTRDAVETSLADVSHVVSASGDPTQLLALIQPGDADVPALLARLADTVERLLEHPRRLAIVASGTPGLGLEGVRRSHLEALISFATADALKAGGVRRFEQLGVERVLSQIPDGPIAEGYVHSVLGPILDSPELLRTLEVYLHHGRNKVATAAAIPMHRSSLMYRLTKLSEALSVDLNDPERCYELWLALRLRRIVAFDGRRAG